MSKHPKRKVYFNIIISLIFILLGIYLISRGNSKNKIFDIPFNLIAGFLSIISNSILAIKWLYILLTTNEK